MMEFRDLIGKTISGAQQMRLDKHDDEGYLKLDFTDGSSCVIVGTYSGYTGNSEDEYPTWIYIEEVGKIALSPCLKLG